jgi:hypothetical protein
MEFLLSASLERCAQQRATLWQLRPGTMSCRAYLKLDCLLSEMALKERRCDGRYNEPDCIIVSSSQVESTTNAKESRFSGQAT